MAYKKSTKDTKTSAKDECFSDINLKVQDAINNTTKWSSNQEKFHKLRMRIKKTKTFPFVGCSNIRMPTAETKIRKLKAALTNVITGIRPYAQVIPSPSGSLDVAGKIEKFLDHLLVDIIQFLPKAVIGIDQELEKGFYVFKPYWRTEITDRIEKLSLDEVTLEEAHQIFGENITPEDVSKGIADKYEVDMSDRVAEDNQKEISSVVEKILSGEKTVNLVLRDVIYDFPDIALVSPERLYVPTDGGFDPQSLQFLVHEFFIPLQQVKANVENKGWNSEYVDEIESSKEMDVEKLTDKQKDLREGIELISNPSEMVKIWEYYGWYDVNDDGVKEKSVITIAPDFQKTLRKVSLPFDNGKFPFIKLFYELTDDRWFSHRGIPEIIEDIIKEIDIQHMQKLDQQTVRNAPMFVYRAGMVNPNLVQFVPNQGIPVNGMGGLRDTIDILNNNNPNVEFSYEREQMLLESKIEELIGQVDFTLQSMINRRQPRTLGEVSMQQQNMQMVFGLDAALHTQCFSDLFTWIWELWCQYGSDQYEFSYFGEKGMEKIRLNKEEVQGKYKITVRGNDQNTNPQVKLQKAQQIMLAIANPIFLQTGVITPIQVANGLKRFYQTLDVPNWEELINMRPQLPPPPDPSMAIEPKFADLATGEKAQVLTKHGIQPDIQGRALDKQQELQQMGMEVGLDQSTNIGGN